MRTPTKAEEKWMVAGKELGCIVCWEFLDFYTEAATHHTDGQTKPGAHFKSFPCCHLHHQMKDNQKPPRWISRHGDGRYRFELEYGTEESLIEKTKVRVSWC